MPPPRRGPAASTMSPVLGRPPCAPRSHPPKPIAPRRREGRPEHRGRPDQTRRGAPCGATRHAREARRQPQPRHKDRCQATTSAWCRKPGEHAQHATNHGTRTGAKRHEPPSRLNSARPAVYPAPAGYKTAAVRMDECAPGGYPAPAGYERSPSGLTSARPEGTQPLPATNRRCPDGLSVRPAATPRIRNTAHTTHSTTHRAGTPVNRNQVAQDTAHTQQLTGKVAQDTAQATRHTKLAHR